MQTVPPTAGPLAACPNCGTRLAQPTERVRFEYGVGVVGDQRCDSCGNHWRYLWQEPRPNRARRLVGPAVVVLVVAAIVAGILAYTRNHDAHFPSTWDARVRPIAARVQVLRGLTFAHPVDVEFLTPAAFQRVVAAGDDSQPRAPVERTTAFLRALGLLGPNVDLGRAETAAQSADTLAFYDSSAKKIYVRGTGPLTVDIEVTLAHELTHVLQDQHFGLNKLRTRAEHSKSGSVDAFTALVEGDATRIQDRYLAGLTAPQRNEYALRSLQAANAADQATKGIPAVVETYFAAPYIFGEPVMQVLAAVGGNNAIDAALTGPTPSTRVYLDPAAVQSTPTVPPIPALLPGETKLASLSPDDDQFDDFTFYLMLAGRLDPRTALRAADAFSAGSLVAYTRGTTTCFRAAVNGVARNASNYLSSVIGRWARTMPDAGVSFTATGVVFHSCDPGRRAAAPSDARIQQAVRLAAGRDALVATLVGQHLPTTLAVCAARLLGQRPDFDAAILNGSALTDPTPAMVHESAEAGATCRGDPTAGLP